MNLVQSWTCEIRSWLYSEHSSDHGSSEMERSIVAAVSVLLPRERGRALIESHERH